MIRFTDINAGRTPQSTALWLLKASLKNFYTSAYQKGKLETSEKSPVWNYEAYLQTGL